MIRDIQEPDNLRARLATTERDNMATDAVIKKRALVFVRLGIHHVINKMYGPTQKPRTVGRTLAIS